MLEKTISEAIKRKREQDREEKGTDRQGGN